MRLSIFIEENIESILETWEHFAKTILPELETASKTEIRDHAELILKAIAIDIASAQSGHQQIEKSQGLRDISQSAMQTIAAQHSSQRAGLGFSIGSLVSEYRSLRASVVRLWQEKHGAPDQEAFDDLIRFNEAIDELIASAIMSYAGQVSRSKDIFLAILGHDLRTPLGAILMSAQFLTRAEALPSHHIKAAARILDSGLRMRKLIEDLLDFTSMRLDKGIPIVPAPTHLAVLCQQAIDEIQAFHPDRAIVFQAPEADITGPWDADRLRQALSNLLGNAIQHGAENAPVRVSLRPEPESWAVAVHNTGPAIAPELLQHIFEPFVQASAAHGYSQGLGLYIAHEVVRAHGGTIGATSSEKEGTTFTIRLPRGPDAAG